LACEDGQCREPFRTLFQLQKSQRAAICARILAGIMEAMNADSKPNSVREPCLRSMAGALHFHVIPPVPSAVEGSHRPEPVEGRFGEGSVVGLFGVNVVALVGERTADPSRRRAKGARCSG